VCYVLCAMWGLQVGYDYSGYGACTGTATDRQAYMDIDAVFDWCVANTPGNVRIVLYGQSIGSGPSCYLATAKRRNSIAGLILHSPILSGVRVLSESRGILACFDIFPNIDRIQRVRCPVFIMHGQEDAEVRLTHGTRLQAAVPRAHQTPPWWVPQRGHNDLTLGCESEYFRRLSLFLNSIPPSERPAEPAGPALDSKNSNGKHSYTKTNSVDDTTVAVDAFTSASIGTRDPEPVS
jgi:fermentation-respiration switch protein FrsA (DUF1100 family)